MNVVELLAELVKIDSVNPDLVPDGNGEAEIARFIASWCESVGLEVHVQTVAGGRANVVAVARGTGGGQSLMLNGHIDTVGVATMDEPFSARVADGKMYGRGTYDMKSGLAACLDVARQAKTMNLRGDVYVSAVCDEEYASIGAQAIVREWSRWPADAVIVTEPTELEVCVAHKGFIWFEAKTYGKAAHGSRPHLGVDAIAKMGKLLVEIEKLDLHLRANASHEYLKSGSIHASLIEGGQELSSYPALCTLGIERRTIPGETADFAAEQLQAIIEKLSASDADFKATIETGLIRNPFEVAPDEAIVQTLVNATAQVFGEAKPLAGNTVWMDAAFFAESGVPTVVYGPHGDGAHGAVEWVDVRSVEQTRDVLLETVRQFCA